MKKIIIALAAVSAIGVGASAAQAKVNIDIHFGGEVFYTGHGYYGHYSTRWILCATMPLREGEEGVSGFTAKKS